MVEDKFQCPPKSPAKHFAIVLPGAVARGAYEAGVIDALAQENIEVARVVATSSGALNGLALAAGIRAGREKEMAAKLIQSWIENGSWQSSLNFSFKNLLLGRGLSNRDGLLKMMRSMITPAGDSPKREVDFCVIVTPLNGVKSRIGKNTATTYEHAVKFTGKDFDTQESLENMFNTVAAACAFPGLFEPVEIHGLGACVDGGAVNNAPIRYALEESDVNRVLIPVPFPALMPPGDWKHGFSLLNHLVEILINERLFRDLKVAQSVNAESDKLKKLMEDGILNIEQLAKIKSALGIRNVEISEIRPKENFKSGSFAGFFQKQTRVLMIEEGRKAALEMIRRLPAENPAGKQTT